jgi:hypothetical protein
MAAPEDRVVALDHASRSSLAPFLLGLPLATMVFYVLLYGPLSDSELRHYVKNPVEYAEVVMFCCAVGAFAGKWWSCGRERRAVRSALLPTWDGRPLPATEAATLLAALGRRPPGLRRTWIGRRLTMVLQFLVDRGAAEQLDDHLRELSDNDALTLDASYSLTRFITWAIPILGFLGTVLGITQAISGVTPEKLENSLSTVTDGLALAFDATALGLALTMVTMFLGYLVERSEQRVLEEVDRTTFRQLAHRFQRVGSGIGDVVQVVRQNAEQLLQATHQVIEQQAQAWARSLAEVDRRQAENEARRNQQLAAALEAAMTRTLEAHARRLEEYEKRAVEDGSGVIEKLAAQAAAVCNSGREQQAALARVMQAISGHTQAVAAIREGEKELLQLQQTLNQNLSALAGAGTFEQAVHSLTAAIHLLTTRSGGQGSQPGARGAAA